MRPSSKWLLPFFLMLLVPGPVFALDDLLETPDLKVMVYNASGSDKIAGAEVTIQDISRFGEAGSENTLHTDSNGLAAFGKKAFDGFLLNPADGGLAVSFDAEEAKASLRGYFKIRVIVRSAGLVSQSSDITVPLEGPMDFTVHLGSDEDA